METRQLPLSLDDERRAEANLVRIEDLIEKHDLQRNITMVDGVKILLLKTDTFVGIEEKRAKDLIAQHKTIEAAGGPGNRCLFVAKEMILLGLADGVIGTMGDVSDVVGLQNHYINFARINEKDILAFDMTAGRNMDNNKGNYDILGIESGNMKSLLSMVGELYGGAWRRF